MEVNNVSEYYRLVSLFKMKERTGVASTDEGYTEIHDLKLLADKVYGKLTPEEKQTTVYTKLG